MSPVRPKPPREAPRRPSKAPQPERREIRPGSTHRTAYGSLVRIEEIVWIGHQPGVLAGKVVLGRVRPSTWWPYRLIGEEVSRTN